MGEIAEMMLDGTLCEGCGTVMDDMVGPGSENAPGYPRRCAGCQPARIVAPEPRHRRRRNGRSRRAAARARGEA
jgi:hypothetical protein